MIELDPRYVTNSDDTSFLENIVQALPFPIAENLRRIEQEANPQVRLQLLCFSLIPMTFQYFALIFSSEYLLSTYPPENEVTESLWAMIRRPGPGKWVGFIREAVTYFLDKETQVVPRETIHAFSRTLLDNTRPRVKYVAEHQSDRGSGQRLDYFEALINMRNRFAHSRHIRRERAEEMCADHIRIWKTLITLLANVCAVRILISDKEATAYDPIDQREFDPTSITPSQTREPMILFNPTTEAYLKLFPLIIPFYEDEHGRGEALLLEETKGKHLLYLYQDDYLKRKEEFRALIKMLEVRTVKAATLSSEELTVAILGERIDALTKKTLTAFEDTLKYLPAMFVARPSVADRLNAWMETDKPGCILAGAQGVGKTSLVADWCVQRRKKGDHVLLLEAAKLPNTDLPKILETLLNLRSPLRDCFDAVYQETTTASPEQGVARFITVFEAVNEFVGTGVDNRTVLWREMNSLVDRLEEQAKRDVLFKLLERMTEFNKTEISLDEFVYGRTAASKRKEKLKHQGEAFQKILFDPRPSSPYKQLLEDGLIEERTVGEGEEQEERIAFCQEKITNMLYTEAKRKEIRKASKFFIIGLLVVGLLVSIGGGVGLYIVFQEINTGIVHDMQESVSKTSLSGEQADHLLGKLQQLVRTWYFESWTVENGFFFMLYLVCFVVYYWEKLSYFWKVQFIQLDLPGRFVTHQFREISYRRFKIVVILGLGYGIYISVRVFSLPREAVLMFLINSVLIGAILLGTLVFLLQIGIVLRYSKTPQSAFCFFGSREAKFNLIVEGGVIILIIILFYGVVPLMSKIEDSAMNPKLLAIQEDLRESADYTFLKQQSLDGDNPADKELIVFLDHKMNVYAELGFKEVINSDGFKKLVRTLLTLFLIAVPIFLALTWLLAYPLEWYIE